MQYNDKIPPIEYTDGNKIWFTSDTHFHHTNILRFCNRPFKDINEMNATIIRNWTNCISEDDYVFHLGDFAFCSNGALKALDEQLTGHIIILKGNHDEKTFKHLPKFKHIEYIAYQMLITVEGQRIYLNHYPFLCYGGVYRNNPTWQLFGHVHSNKQDNVGKDISRLNMLFPYQYDVGVDNNDFTPVNFYKIKEIINRQTAEYLKRGL